MSSKVTYRQQYTRCGKERCRKCKESAGHGPYWYAYWSENGRTISKYIGIRLPSHIEITRRQAKETEDSQEISPVEPQLITPGKENATPPDINSGLPLRLPTQVLRVHVLGQFRVDRLQCNEWQVVVNRTLRRRRARALLGCLLSQPGHRLGREQAMEALWPDLDMETAANRLNGAVHELRQILEPELARPAASRMLRLERDVLELADRSQIWIDADVFENLLNEANSIGVRNNNDTESYQNLSQSDAEQIERLLEDAAALYDGDYLLEELYSEWATPRREALRRGWIGLLLRLAELREKRGALAAAMEPLNRLLATDPTDETAVQRLMLLLTQLDRRGEALNTYRLLATRLQHNFDSEPLPETRELYEKLRMGHIIKVSQPKILTAQIAHEHEHASLEKHLLQATDPRAQSISAAGDQAIPHILATFASTSQSGRYNQSPLVGRVRELDTMRQILRFIEETPQAFLPIDPDNEHSLSPEEARRGEMRKPHVLLLMGDAGIGKTRLAEELSHEAKINGWSVAWTRAYEQEGTVPYRAWIELLRTLLKQVPVDVLVASAGIRSKEETPTSIHYTPTILERLSTLLPELRDLLPQNGKTYLPLPPEQERLHLWEATLGLLDTLSKNTPLLLVLDDLHWTDGSSHELLAYLTRHIQDQRILLLATCRDIELAPSHGLRSLIADLRREQAIYTLIIQPLTQAQIGSLIAHLPQNVVQSIQTRAAGNPFFAEELARVSESMQVIPPRIQHPERGVHAQASTHYNERRREVSTTSSALPEGIAAVLDRRLGRLSNVCQTLLGKASVLGGSFEFNQLLFMANEHHEDAILDLLEEALRAGLLTEEGTGARITYHFWHPLIVNHLYERLSAARCAQLHRRAANALLHTYLGHEEEVAAAITHHLSKGGADAAQIAYYAELTGAQAYSLSAYAEAEQYYLLATKTLTRGMLPLEMSTDETEIHKVVRSIANPLHIARLLERVCECCIVQGNFEEARKYYEGILELRKQQPPIASEAESKQEAQIQALIWREIGRTWASNGDYEQSYECYKRGTQVMRDAGVTSGAAWACIHLQYGSIRNLEGSYDEARRYVLEALDMLEEAIQQRKVSQGNASTAQPSSVESKIHQFLTRTERAAMGDVLEVGRAHELLGIIAASIGQFTEALTHLYRALAIFEQHDLVIEMVKVCSNLGAVHAVKSENSVAYSYMNRSLELAERMSNLPIIALTTGNLGEMAARAGDLLKAEEWLRRSLAIAERTNELEHQCWANISLAVALQDQGNLQGAATGIRRSLAIARTMKSARNIGGALIALADLRVVQAIIAFQLQSSNSTQYKAHLSPMCTRLLLRARSTALRAIQVEGLESELVVEGQVILASIYFLLKDLPTARQEAVRAMENSEKYELTRMLARSYRLLGRILSAQSEYEKADAYFENALQIFRDYEFRLDYARALHDYAKTLLQRGRPGTYLYKKGLAHLQEARTIFADCHAAIDLAWANQLLASFISETVEA